MICVNDQATIIKTILFKWVSLDYHLGANISLGTVPKSSNKVMSVDFGYISTHHLRNKFLNGSIFMGNSPRTFCVVKHVIENFLNFKLGLDSFQRNLCNFPHMYHFRSYTKATVHDLLPWLTKNNKTFLSCIFI